MRFKELKMNNTNEFGIYKKKRVENKPTLDPQPLYSTQEKRLRFYARLVTRLDPHNLQGKSLPVLPKLGEVLCHNHKSDHNSSTQRSHDGCVIDNLVCYCFWPMRAARVHLDGLPKVPVENTVMFYMFYSMLDLLRDAPLDFKGGAGSLGQDKFFFFLQPGKESFFYFQYLMGQVFFFF